MDWGCLGPADPRIDINFDGLFFFNKNEPTCIFKGSHIL